MPKGKSRLADEVRIMVFLRGLVGSRLADSDWKQTRDFVAAVVEHAKSAENERICRLIYKFARLEQHTNYRGLLRAMVPIIRGWRKMPRSERRRSESHEKRK